MRRLRITVRLALMVCWLVLCAPAQAIAGLFFHHSPIPRLFLAGIARLAGVRVRTAGTRQGTRTVILANHVSWLDIPVLASASGTAFIAHDGLADSPFLKWLCEANDTVFVARTRRSTVAQQVEQVRQALDRSPVLALFPEGTTSDGAAMLPLKSALLSAVEHPPDGTAIQPVLIEYGTATQEIAWVGDEPGLANFFAVLARREPIEAGVHYLDPLAGAALADRKAIAAATRNALTAALSKARETA